MRILIIFVVICWCEAAKQRPVRQQGPGWDIRLAVPGNPGNDYPTLDAIPKTSFSCSGRNPGYYADIETNCQVFRVCTAGSTYGFQSFLCPNGTLFNQAVFVCDWWMNVNCDSSQQYFNTNDQKFGSLRMGPQLMNDVKKMITHPMRNPYDKGAMKSNFVVMQEYKPPAGQLSPNAPVILGPKKFLENIYVPSKQILQNFAVNDNSIDNEGASSTLSPLYNYPSNGNNIQNPQRDTENFQRQTLSGQSAPRKPTNNGQYVQPKGVQSGKYVHSTQQQFSQNQNGQYYQNNFHKNQQNKANFVNTQSLQSGNIISNSHAGQLSHPKQQNTAFVSSGQTNGYNRQNYNFQANSQYNQQVVKQNKNTQNSQYTDHTRQNSFAPVTNGQKQTEYGISYTKQQYTTNQANQFTIPQFSSDISTKAGKEAKQNLVSNSYVPPSTVIAKTLTFNRIIQEPKPGGPKSRITFKTWIVKPSKTARIVATPTPYTYDRPTNQPQRAQKIVAVPTKGYYYDKPTPQSQKIISEPEPYYYNPPSTTSQPQRVIVENDGYYYNPPTIATQTENIIAETGYVYNRPTASARQLTSPLPSTTSPPRRYLSPLTSPVPTLPPKQYLAPTTFKPAVRLYIPPSETPTLPSRQYLNPNELQRQSLPRTLQQNNYQSAQLQASPSAPTPVIVRPNLDKSLFSVVKHSRINTNHNNLTFTDILTKEKLDITVNDIVKDTRNILGTAAPPEDFGRLQQETAEYDDGGYLGTDSYAEDAETLTPAPPDENISKVSRLVQKPSIDLEPPINNFENSNTRDNRIANLPFYKETVRPTNTIERTVSLKISIPEKTAEYLFKTSNASDFDKLEILNTGSSNYLVLTNQLTKNPSSSFIPIGKLIVDKNSNFSNSQALVFSFLADSINQAKEYKNLAESHHNLLSSTPLSHSQNINNEDLNQITNQVAQLTSAQYTTNNPDINEQHRNVPATPQTTQGTPSSKPAKYTNNVQNEAQQYSNSNGQNIQSGQFFSSQFNTNTPVVNANLQINNGQNQLYSGQLYQVPVPELSNIYNEQNPDRFISQNSANQPNNEVENLHSNTNTVDNNNLDRPSSTEVEVVQSQSVPLAAPAKLQAEPTQEPQSFSSQEDPTQSFIGNFVNSGNGISAQLQDKIVGTIAHPHEENKLVTYKKDQSYYVYTKLDNLNGIRQTSPSELQTQNAKLTQSSNADNVVTFQFIPSLGYQLDDEREQQKLLNAFQIDEFGSPRRPGSHNQNGNAILTSNVEYSVEHTPSRQQSSQYNNVGNLYAGPSSYSAPQGSVGNLETQQGTSQHRNNNVNAAKLEIDESSNGYAKRSPSRQFPF